MKIFNYTANSHNHGAKKFLTISDLHIYSSKDVQKLKVIEKVLSDKLNKKGLRYDGIFIVGDILDTTNVLKEDKETSQELANFFISLSDYAPLYIVLGNHDISFFSELMKTVGKSPWIKDRTIINQELLSKIEGHSKINILDNNTIDLGDGYTISGLTPPLSYVFDMTNENKILSEGRRYDFLRDLKPDNINILLCHYPDVILYLYRRTTLLKHANLIVAGHNHNGMTQLRVFPLELILNLLGQHNRGLITPGKSFNFEDTKFLRGLIHLDENSDLLINPAFESLSHINGFLYKFNWMFYRGATEISFEPNDNLKLSRIK